MLGFLVQPSPTQLLGYREMLGYRDKMENNGLYQNARLQITK